ncbi:hypothetical protein B0T22DRAFT_171838 [Podospora appendiculata]|uniref:BTB domain-containing protein n=1 Tax=Podospora appendiculata TaxID=314037 RepID=A0AAE0XBI3_9PEZI|nr:hypothetical protein B0T22DRAFT_171838 [Podospora appendiculata]
MVGVCDTCSGKNSLQDGGHKRLTFIDPEGDLTLQVGPKGRCFVVSSVQLARASRFFRAMLDGKFREGKAANKHKSKWVVKLPEDNASGFEVLLNIMHSRTFAVPYYITTRLLFRVTVLTDKYDLLPLLKPWAARWCSFLSSRSCCRKGTVCRLWIAYELGNKSDFENMLERMVWTFPVDENGEFLDHEGKRLDKMVKALPTLHGAIEGATDYRRRLANDYYRILRETVGELSSEGVKCSGLSLIRQNNCEKATGARLLWAAFTRGVLASALPSGRVPIDGMWTDRLDVLEEGLYEMQDSLLLPDPSEWPCNCGWYTRFGKRLKDDIWATFKRNDYGLFTTVHFDHLDKQAERSGLKPRLPTGGVWGVKM